MTRPYLPANVQRDCRLYRVHVLNPHDGYRTVTKRGYLGESAREPFTRFIEHLYTHPWSDTIVGPPEVDPRVFRSKAEVWAAEKAAVEDELPIYNAEWQPPDNPHRISYEEQVRQRHERDRKAGRPLWQPGDRTQRGAGPGPVARRTAPRLKRRPMSRTDRRRAGWATAWLVAAVAVWVWVSYSGTAGVVQGAGIGAGGASAAGVGLAYWTGSRKRRRLIESALFAVAVAAGFGYAQLAGRH